MIGVQDVSVRFGQTQALDRVNVEVSAGSIHALAGENGSGKSTLLKVLGGVIQPSVGHVILNGQPIALDNVRDGLQYGIGIVFQELSLFPHLSGFSNIVIGREPQHRGLLDDKTARNRVRQLWESVNFPNIDLARPVGELPVSEQQMVEILKCLYRSPRIVLFDEPTASLPRGESESLLQAIRNLRAAGYTIVFVSHHLDEVFSLADTVTVLRDGHVVLDSAVADVNQEQVMVSMLGRTFNEFYPVRSGVMEDRVFISLNQVVCDGIEPVDLEVHDGEILGIAGAVGSGASTLAEMIAGRRPMRSGEMRVADHVVRFRRPADALVVGIGYVPEDRRTEALLPNLPISTNGTLPLVAQTPSPLVGRGFLRFREERHAARRMVDHLGVRARNAQQVVASLSGGNQQKVIIGRWYLRDVHCLVLNNPTKGIDVGAKHEIYRYINELADSHHAVVCASAYNNELLGIADRIVVFYKGRMLGPFQRSELDEESLLRLTLVGTVDSGTLPSKGADGGQYGIS